MNFCTKFLLIFLIFIFSYSATFAEEILIYADSITYDKDKNLIAKGNAKVIRDKEIITSEIIIIDEITMVNVFHSFFVIL